MTDAERLDWLDASREHLQDVYWRKEKTGEDVRTAIDKLIEMGKE